MVCPFAWPMGQRCWPPMPLRHVDAPPVRHTGSVRGGHGGVLNRMAPRAGPVQLFAIQGVARAEATTPWSAAAQDDGDVTVMVWPCRRRGWHRVQGEAAGRCMPRLGGCRCQPVRTAEGLDAPVLIECSHAVPRGSGAGLLSKRWTAARHAVPGRRKETGTLPTNGRWYAAHNVFQPCALLLIANTYSGRRTAMWCASSSTCDAPWPACPD